MSQAQVDRINALGAQLDKARNELVDEFAKLRAEVQNATEDPAVTEALDRFAAKVQVIDDLVVDPTEAGAAASGSAAGATQVNAEGTPTGGATDANPTVG